MHLIPDVLPSKIIHQFFQFPHFLLHLINILFLIHKLQLFTLILRLKTLLAFLILIIHRIFPVLQTHVRLLEFFKLLVKLIVLYLQSLVTFLHLLNNLLHVAVLDQFGVFWWLLSGCVCELQYYVGLQIWRLLEMSMNGVIYVGLEFIKVEGEHTD